jgi:hypothetical protein
MLVIRSGDRERLAPCLRRLVPVLQRAQAEFMAAPGPALDRIVKAMAAFRAGFSYDRGNAGFGACQLRDLGLVSATRAGTLGAVEQDKVDRMLDLIRPLLAAQRRPARAGLTAADVATNDFIDPRIGLPTTFRTPRCEARRSW